MPFGQLLAVLGQDEGQVPKLAARLVLVIKQVVVDNDLQQHIKV